ncbi:MAG: hypothetical protein CL946_07950 [Ectothiorhodospiraceae bacterium]|nr:hypothetical protein [Ectothiorhodospiraceae bacterium]
MLLLAYLADSVKSFAHSQLIPAADENQRQNVQGDLAQAYILPDVLGATVSSTRNCSGRDKRILMDNCPNPYKHSHSKIMD